MPSKDPKIIMAYRKKNAENNKAYLKEYRQTEQGKKSLIIGRWKYKGLIGDREAVYERYINTSKCDCCKIDLIAGKTGGNHKVMDHCHKTGKFRNVLCHNCNILRYHLDNNYHAYLKMMTL